MCPLHVSGWITLSNIYPAQTLTCWALPIAQATTLLIPESAVVPFGQMDKVFVVEEGRARLRLVRTGGRTNEQVEILAGIRPGDTVIIDNNTLLVSGQPVTVN